MSFRTDLVLILYPSPTETGDLSILKRVLCDHGFSARVENVDSGDPFVDVAAASHFDQGGSPFFVEWRLPETSETHIEEVAQTLRAALSNYWSTCTASRGPTIATEDALAGPVFEAHWDDRLYICTPWKREKMVKITTIPDEGPVVPVSVIDRAGGLSGATSEDVLRSVVAHTHPVHRKILDRARDLEPADEVLPDITGDWALLRMWLASVLRSGSGRLAGPELKAEVHRFLESEAARAATEDLVVVHGSWGDGFAIHGPFGDQETAQKWAETETADGEAWWIAAVNDPLAED